MNTAMYDRALRNKLRFASPKGELSLELLWDAPLRARNGFDLDAIAKLAHRALKDVSEESFVSTRKSPAESLAELRFEIIKYVIEVKLDEAAKAEDRHARDAEREKLKAILEEKQDEKLKDMDEEAIQKRLAELGA